jgi:4-amino-4-deoxy-L-arabinose transferase-like glycosyltransferase
MNAILQMIVIVLTCIAIVRYASLYEEEYSQKLIDLYVHPWWRMLLVFLLVAAAIWSPGVGIIIAFLAFFYLSDMNTLVAPLSS